MGLVLTIFVTTGAIFKRDIRLGTEVFPEIALGIAIPGDFLLSKEGIFPLLPPHIAN